MQHCNTTQEFSHTGARAEADDIDMKILSVGLLLALARVSVCALNTHNSFLVNHVRECPGLYFEKMSPLRLQHADWRVTVFVDVKRFIKDFPSEGARLQGIISSCSLINSNSICRELLRIDYINSQLDRARRLVNELLQVSHDSRLVRGPVEDIPHTIARRSVPLGIIGSLSKSLFGTLNEEDAEYINDQIDRLYADQANLTHLIGRQMHITTSRLQILHEENIVEAKRVEELTKHITHLQMEINMLRRGEARIQYNSSLVNYAQRVEVRVDRYIHTCEHYLRVIAAARDGRFDSTILTTDQLLSIGKEVQLKAAIYEFPITMEYARPETLAIIARTDLIYHQNRMVIVVHIPLLDRINYQLYYMHPWPVQQRIGNETGSAYVLPSFPYLALSGDHRTFFMADSVYLASCRYADRKLICSMETPVHEVATSNSCVIEMLTRPSHDALRKCNVRIHAPHEDFWAHLPHQGGWLFSLGEPESLRILCPGLPDETVEIKGAGILHLSPNCIGRTRSTTLTGTRIYDQREHYIYRPETLLNITLLAPILSEEIPVESDFLSLTSSSAITIHDVMSDWKSQEHGASLFDIEKKIKEIGSHRRERVKQRGLFLVGFIGQGGIIIIILVCLCRSRLIKKVSSVRRRRSSRPDQECVSSTVDDVASPIASHFSQGLGKNKEGDSETKQMTSTTIQSGSVPRLPATLPMQTARTD